MKENMFQVFFSYIFLNERKEYDIPLNSLLMLVLMLEVSKANLLATFKSFSNQAIKRV
jgi:hypothetical protein